MCVFVCFVGVYFFLYLYNLPFYVGCKDFMNGCEVATGSECDNSHGMFLWLAKFDSREIYLVGSHTSDSLDLLGNIIILIFAIFYCCITESV